MAGIAYLLVTAVTLIILAFALAFLFIRGATNRHFTLAGLLLATGVLPAAGFLSAAITASAAATPVANAAFRLSVILLVCVSLLTIVRPRHRRAEGLARYLWLGGMAFAGSALVIGLYQGNLGADSWPLLLPLAMTAVWLGPHDDPRWFLIWSKRVGGIYIVASWAVAFLFPEVAWLPTGLAGSASYIPGVEARLQGIFANPNALAPIAALYLALEYAVPSPRLSRTGLGLAAVAALVFAQSKTIWLAAALACIMVWFAREGSRGRRRLLMGLACAIVAAAVLFPPATTSPLQDVFVTPALVTRADVWQYGLERWRESPVLGAGAGVFIDYADYTGRAWAAKPHNQLVYSLAREGLVGTAGLLVYVFALLRVAYVVRNRTGGISLAFACLLLVPVISETPLSAFGYVHFVVFAALMSWAKTETPLAPLRSRSRVRIDLPLGDAVIVSPRQSNAHRPSQVRTRLLGR